MIVSKRKSVSDPGMDEPAKSLNPEKIKKVINRVLKKAADIKLKTYIETFIHCGLCSEVCHYLLLYKREKSYAPIGKVRQSIL